MNNDEQRPADNSFYDAVFKDIYEYEKENVDNAGTNEDTAAKAKPCENTRESGCAGCDCGRR